MLFGVIDEMRIFYEIYALGFLLIIPSIAVLFGVVPDVNIKNPGGTQ